MADQLTGIGEDDLWADSDCSPGVYYCELVGVSENWLSTFGVEPIKGRTLTSEEGNGRNNVRVALVSFGFWERRFISASFPRK